jgi:nitrite reductase (NADH) large subunit
LVAQPPGKYRRLVFHNRRLVGAIAIGEWPEYPRVQELVHRQARLWGWQENRFRHTGALWRESAVRPVQDWPASALVCNCVGVRRGQLSRHCQEGCATVEQLAAITGASSICGSCKPLLAQLVGAPPVSAALPGTRGLLAASLLALLLAGGVSALNPIPFSSTVQEGWHWDQLWRDGFWKKTSGFSLLGLSVLSLGLSLRKRIPRFQWGAVGMWRAFHAGLGVLMLLLLITHTGFRLGKNLNFVLMIDFLALAALGAMAGGINALDSRFGGPAARRLRAVWTGAHVALVWPLPVLIVAHVLMAYWF